MATTYQHSFQHADGRIETRDSKSRIYTHVVVTTYGSADKIRPCVWSGTTEAQAAADQKWAEENTGKEVVLSWSWNLKNATNAARAVKLNGYWVKVRVAECQMVEHVSKPRKAAL